MTGRRAVYVVLMMLATFSSPQSSTGGEKSAVKWMLRLVKPDVSEEANEPFQDLAQEHEEEEDDDKSLNEENGIRNPASSGLADVNLSMLR